MFQKKRKEVNYFDLFVECTDDAIKQTTLLYDICKEYNFKTIDENKKRLQIIEEHSDQLCQSIYEELVHSFMTPIERVDIFTIVKGIHEITRHTKEFPEKLSAFTIFTLKAGTFEYIQLLIETTKILKEVMKEFKNYKKSKVLLFKINELKKIKQQADHFYLNQLHRLYTNEKNVVEIMKWLDLNNILKDCIESCEKVIHELYRVILKNS